MAKKGDDAAILHAISKLKLELIGHLDAKLDNIQQSINSLQTSLSTLGDRVGELEGRVGTNQDDIVGILQRLQKLEKQNAYLAERAEDAENRSRALNLRILRVPEQSEGRDMVAFVHRLLSELLGKDNLPNPLCIERAHRTAVTSAGSRFGARPILIKLLHFQDKLKILRLAHEKGELLFSGQRIHIYPDFSAGLREKRRQFDPLKKQLRELGIRYALLYPAVMRIHVDGKQHSFRSPGEAEAFCSALPSKPK